MQGYWMISEAAREVEVESHVLRYWEEELKLPIKRNEQGHRYYTEEDVEVFKKIKEMKEKGLQLKAIKMIMKNGDLDVLPDKEELMLKKANSDLSETLGENAGEAKEKAYMQTQDRTDRAVLSENKEEKTQRLQWLLQQLIREAVRENNRELCQDIKESVVKELDYQFRNLEEREELRDAAREQREEEHFRKLDDLLTKKARKSKGGKDQTAWEAVQTEEVQKNKRGGFFKTNKSR